MAIQWRDQPILDSVQLPGSNTKYWVADREAREKIETLIGATRFMGVTTTELKDGDTTNPIIINEESYTAQTGDIVIYTPLTGSSLEFIWDGSKWQLLGGQAIENLGALAYKNSASGNYTPEGSVNVNVVNAQNSAIYSAELSNLAVTVEISDQSTEMASIKGQLYLNISYDTVDVLALSDVTADFDAASETVHYISDITVPDAILTGAPAIQKYDVVVGYSLPGALPTLSNQNTMVATVGTGSSSTTLIFSLSNIGFSQGSFPILGYSSITGLSSVGSFTSSIIVVRDANKDFVTSVEFSISTSSISIPTLSNFGGAVDLYYGASVTGSIVTSAMSVLSDVTATFSGSSTTITVS